MVEGIRRRRLCQYSQWVSVKSFYVIGSLRNPGIPEFANQIEALGVEAFADWYSPGPNADDHLKEYAKARGWSYRRTLESHAATHVFKFDKHHIDRCEAAVLLAPAGRSGHIELGYVLGKGKPGYIVFEGEPEDRYDIMLQFATKIFFSREEFFDEVKLTKEK